MTQRFARVAVSVGTMRSWVPPVVVACTLFVPSQSGAQVQRSEFSVQSSLTATNNGAGEPQGLERKDLLLAVSPSLSMFRQGAGLRLRADAGADLLTSARETRRDRVLPRLSFDAQAGLVEGLLFLDTLADVRQVEVDPLGARVEGASVRNAQTTGNYRIHPFLVAEAASGMAVRAGVESAQTRVAGSDLGDLDTRRGQMRVEYKPRPLGAALEWLGERTEYGGAAESNVRDDRLTGTLNLAVDADWLLGAAFGRERSQLPTGTRSENLYGVRALWVPGPRTEFAASVDRRFFGAGGSMAVRHRTPRMSFSLGVSREPVNAAAGERGGLADFLDAVLTTRNPDAGQRFSLVRDLAAINGIEGGFMTASGVAASYPQLRTSGSLRWLYQGPRTTLTMSLYAQRLVQLVRADGGAATVEPPTADTRQRGMSFGWGHRIDPVTALNLGLSRSRAEGLALRAGQVTDENMIRADLVRSLSRRTTLTLGLVVRRVDSDAVGVNAFDETAGIIGLGHRF